MDEQSPKEKRITSFRDLWVFQNSYQAMLSVMRQIIPVLPHCEKYDLADQIRRACKAVPRLIAEGYAKRHQKAGFQKYLDDAMAECNELIVSLCQVKDIYPNCAEEKICADLVETYDKTVRQLYKLSTAWTHYKKRLPKPLHDTSIDPDNDTGLS